MRNEEERNCQGRYQYSEPLCSHIVSNTANISKFSDSENALKTLKICVIIPVFFDPENGGKICDLFKNFQLKKILRKAQVSLAFFDVINCNNECEPVKPLSYIIIKKNHRKTCAFLEIF